MPMNSLSQRFACPVHKTALDHGFHCVLCHKAFPLAHGIPILLNDRNSVFSTDDYLESESAYVGASGYAGSLDQRIGLRQLYRRAMFRLRESSPPRRDFGVEDAIEHILSIHPDARILVIGAGDTSLKGNITYTDVAFGRNVTCIADAHDLPFLDHSFDACVACAVLEHVADPYRCVEEMIRILQPDGYVFAETPFMQPVHMGAHDFTRFTFLGHRRLFRRFEEIRSGMCGGVGVSTGHLMRYAISALSDRRTLKKWLNLVGLVGTFPLRWIDHLTYRNESSFDSASGFYFLGKLRAEPISDRELITLFRGG